MSLKYYKYPRTPHLDFSPGIGDDDIQLKQCQVFTNCHVVVTEKLDGENTTLYPDHIHARSLDSCHHPSRAWVKALQATISPDIPQGWRLCGENLYAQHSIAYENLASYFYLFSIWNQDNYCLSWSETQEWSEILGLCLPQVLYQGKWDKTKIEQLSLDLDLDKCEGFVIRNTGSFHYDDFAQNIAKWVRPHHVQTDKHWMQQTIIPNQLKQ